MWCAILVCLPWATRCSLALFLIHIFTNDDAMAMADHRKAYLARSAKGELDFTGKLGIHELKEALQNRVASFAAGGGIEIDPDNKQGWFVLPESISEDGDYFVASSPEVLGNSKSAFAAWGELVPWYSDGTFEVISPATSRSVYTAGDCVTVWLRPCACDRVLV